MTVGGAIIVKASSGPATVTKTNAVIPVTYTK